MLRLDEVHLRLKTKSTTLDFYSENCKNISLGTTALTDGHIFPMCDVILLDLTTGLPRCCVNIVQVSLLSYLVPACDRLCRCVSGLLLPRGDSLTQCLSP